MMVPLASFIDGSKGTLGNMHFKQIFPLVHFSQPMAVFVVQRVGVGLADPANLLASAVVGVVHHDRPSALGLSDPATRSVHEFQCRAADRGRVADRIVGARCACHRTQAMVGGRVGVALRDGVDLGAEPDAFWIDGLFRPPLTRRRNELNLTSFYR